MHTHTYILTNIHAPAQVNAHAFSMRKQKKGAVEKED